jgi:flavodoxin
MTVTILYFSSSGNTENMARLLADRVREGGCRVLLTDLHDARISDLSQTEVLLVGSPAWTGEQVVEPLHDFLITNANRLRGKQIAFFGSYDWGEGRYFDQLTQQLRGKGLNVYDKPLLVRTEDAELQVADAETFLTGVLGTDSRT